MRTSIALNLEVRRPLSRCSGCHRRFWIREPFTLCIPLQSLTSLFLVPKYYLNDKGILIIGIDHYLENKESLNWDKEYNLYTNTLSKDEWLNIFKNEHFSNIKLEVFNKKDNWGGTLIIFAQKL